MRSNWNRLSDFEQAKTWRTGSPHTSAYGLSKLGKYSPRNAMQSCLAALFFLAKVPGPASAANETSPSVESYIGQLDHWTSLDVSIEGYAVRIRKDGNLTLDRDEAPETLQVYGGRISRSERSPFESFFKDRGSRLTLHEVTFQIASDCQTTKSLQPWCKFTKIAEKLSTFVDKLVIMSAPPDRDDASKIQKLWFNRLSLSSEYYSGEKIYFLGEKSGELIECLGKSFPQLCFLRMSIDESLVGEIIFTKRSENVGDLEILKQFSPDILKFYVQPESTK